MSTLRVGTRGSLLALTQTRAFVDQVSSQYPDISFEEILIQTAGDMRTEPLQTATEPGLFVSALRDALLAKKVDFIVHSMKDLPAASFTGIATGCIPKREDNRDVLVSRDNLTLAELSPGSVVGTSSPRRTASLRRIRPDLIVRPIRGNIDTRIRKVRDGDFDATILALAGLNRIGRASEASEIFEESVGVAAAGQGALSVECRADDIELRELLLPFDDQHTRITTTAERAVLRGLQAGCATAIGASANLNDGTLTLVAELAVEETGESAAIKLEATLTDSPENNAEQLGRDAARLLLRNPLSRRAAWT